MPTLAVEVTAVDEKSHPNVRQGILTYNPEIGKNCIICLGGNTFFCIAGIRGWIRPSDKNYLILFDQNNARYRVEVIASSEDFLL